MPQMQGAAEIAGEYVILYAILLPELQAVFRSLSLGD